MSTRDRQQVSPTDIAIIGMAGRFPGCRDVEEFWQNLRDGVECIRRPTDEELLAAGVDPEELRDPNYVKATGDLADVGGFDAGFFGYSPKDAAILDPQHRHFYECAWAALEHAGHTAARFPGPIGVFAGCGPNLYFMRNVLPNPELQRTVGYFLLRHTGNDRDFLPTGVSYKLNLRGPSIAVQTACSTSLVAIHVASQSLLNGECDMALAGGVTIDVPHSHGYLFRENEILSPDGHCRSFDARSAGTVLSSGCGVIVLRRAEDAIADGDFIHALIKGSAVNNDGANKVGYLAPSVDGHAAVVAEALALAGLTAEDISYIETHGTGTSVGDPIEVAALTQAFRQSTQRTQFCPIGAVKASIGHTDTAAGVAGLMKVVESLRHRQIPKSLHFESPNPKIDFASSPFYVSSELREWKTDGKPRRAGVSSLGVGGTNAHAILEEAPSPVKTDPALPWQPLVLSAKTPTALDRMTVNLSEFFRRQPDVNLADVAYTLQIGRSAFEHRRVLVAKDVADAIVGCEQRDPKRVVSGRAVAGEPSIVFMFPGGGVQYPNMGRDLYDTEEVYHQSVDECLRLLKPHVEFDLRQLMFPNPGGEAAAAEQLLEVCASICAIFTTEYATAQLLLSWGIQPKAMTGHSLGEYAAACLAGVMSLADALKIVALRGRLLERTRGASMLTVPLPEAEVRQLLGDDLDLAAVNGPSFCLISGLNDQLDVLERQLAEREIECRRLHLSAASHCRLLDPVLDEFRAGFESITLNPPSLPFISNSTGTWVLPQDAQDPNHWVRHLRHCVRFGDGLSELMKLPNPVFLEVGPGRTLSSLTRQQPVKPTAIITSIRHPDEEANDVQFIRASLGRLWSVGVDVDWSKLRGLARRQRVPLPTYPFEHQHYWLEPVKQAGATVKPPATIVKLPSIDEWFYQPVWKPVPATAPISQESGTPSPVTLVFLDNAGLGTRVAKLLRDAGETVITVREADAYYKFGEYEYALAAEEGRAGYDELVADLVEGGNVPNRILHLWLVTKDRTFRPGSSFFHRNQERGVFSLIFLTQALGEQEQIGDLHIAVVSSGMQSVESEPVEHAEKATVLGPVRVIPRENKHISCSSIDIALPNVRRRRHDDEIYDSIASQLIAELRMDAGNRTVALRDRRRLEQYYEAIPFRPSGSRTRLRKGGTYVITGGLGGIGMRLAGYLARKCQAKLVLFSRSGLPDRDTWEQWFEQHSKRDPISRRILAIQDMESLGAQVLVAAADVANIEDMHHVLADARKRFGKIDGVFHTAAILDDGVLQAKTVESMDRVFTPKVHGTQLLAELLADHGLDFFVLFSSTSAVFGPAGQADYTAANCFLNAFAETEVGRRLNTMAINWGVWKDVGMGLAVATRIIGETGDEEELLRRTGHPLLDEWIHEEPDRSVFSTTLSASRHWVLDEHRMQSGQAVVPGTGYIELASAAFGEATGSERIEIRDLSFIAPLAVSDDETREIRTFLTKNGDGSHFEVKSRVSGEWLLHASGKVGPLNRLAAPSAFDWQAIQSRCPKVLATDGNGLLSIRQIELLRFGPRWHVVQSARFGSHEAAAELLLPAEFESDLDTFRLHPAVLDLATGFALPLVNGYDQSDVLYVPMSYGRVRVYGSLPNRVFSHVRSAPENDASRDVALFDVTIADEQGNVVVEVEQLSLRKIAEGSGFGAPSRQGVARQYQGDNLSPGEKLFLELLAAGIDGEEGMAALEKMLSAPSLPHQVVASSISIEVLLDRFAGLKETPDEVSGVKFSRPNLGSTYEAPRNALERQLAEFWEELLGVDDIGIHDDFFELGGHSLIAVRLFAKIKKTWNAEYPISVLFQAPTIAGCAELLQDEIGDVPDELVDDQATVPRVRKHRYLVPMNRVVEATRPPFFLVAGMFGNVLNLRHLAGHLGADQPVYALQARGLHGDDKPHTRFEEMARDYLEEVRQIQPQGPYFLGGFSGGGISAYEMALQLISQGEQIGALVMLDTPPPPPCTPQLTWPDRVKIQAYRVRRRGLRYFVEWLRNRWDWEMRRFRPAEPQELTPAEFRSGEIQSGFLEAIAHYVPPIYAGSVHLFRPRLQETYSLGGGRFASDARVIVDDRNHWTPFVTGAIHVHEVTGNHDSMVLEPHVRVLARELRTCLTAAQTQAAEVSSPEIEQRKHDTALVSAS
jgi:acyl transferase domain-containing protein/thioesterase domain-containing protein